MIVSDVKNVKETAEENVAHGGKQGSPADWGFQSFSTTKLMGTYSNLSIKINSKSDTEASTEPSSLKNPDPNPIVTDASANTDSNEPVGNITPAKRTLHGADLLLIARKLLFVMELERDKWRFERLCRSILEHCNSDRNVKVRFMEETKQW